MSARRLVKERRSRIFCLFGFHFGTIRVSYHRCSHETVILRPPGAGTAGAARIVTQVAPDRRRLTAVGMLEALRKFFQSRAGAVTAAVLIVIGLGACVWAIVATFGPT